MSNGKLAGRAVARLLDSDPELHASFCTRLAATSAGLDLSSALRQAVGQLCVDGVLDPTKVALNTDTVRQDIAGNAAQIEQLEQAWEAEFGEAYPRHLNDWTRWAVRVGWDAELVRQGQWTPGDLIPYIEGWIQRLSDTKHAESLAPVTTPEPAAARAPSPKRGQNFSASKKEELESRGRQILIREPKITREKLAKLLGVSEGYVSGMSCWRNRNRNRSSATANPRLGKKIGLDIALEDKAFEVHDSDELVRLIDEQQRDDPRLGID